MATIRPEVLLSWINEFHHELNLSDHEVSLFTLEHFTIATRLIRNSVIVWISSCCATSSSRWFTFIFLLVISQRCNLLTNSWCYYCNSFRWSTLLYSIVLIFTVTSLDTFGWWIERFRLCHLLFFNVYQPVETKFVEHGKLTEGSRHLDKHIVVQEERFKVNEFSETAL